MNEQTLPQNEFYTPETDLQTPQVSQEISAENPFPNVQQFNPSGENPSQTEAVDAVPNFPEATPPAMPAENVVTLQTENDLAQEIMGTEPKIETAPKPEVSIDSTYTAVAETEEHPPSLDVIGEEADKAFIDEIDVEDNITELIQEAEETQESIPTFFSQKKAELKAIFDKLTNKEETLSARLDELKSKIMDIQKAKKKVNDLENRVDIASETLEKNKAA